MKKKNLVSKPFGNDKTRWLQTLVVVLLTVGVFSVMWELTTLHTKRSFLEAFEELEPHVSSDDLLHLSHLQDACRLETDTVLPWSYAAPGNDADRPVPRAQSSTSLLHQGDPRLLEELRQCPDVDIYLPSSGRGPAGCAAVVGPLKFLQSRLLPDWALDVELYGIVERQKTRYFDLCPSTPMLFLAPEHVLTVTKSPSWPSTKPVYLMAPGLDLKASPSTQFTRSVLERTDVVLCRTKRCDQDVKQFLQRRSGMDNDTKVMYTSQVTADPYNFARRMRGDRATRKKNAADFAIPRFAHTTWNISSASTQNVISCWSSQAKELPPLDVYLLRDNPADGARLFKPFPANSNTTIKTLDALTFAGVFGSSSFFICPTADDDCLDLARASAGVIVTANAYPMNELVTDSEGILFPTKESTEDPDDALLLPPSLASYSRSDLCRALLKTHMSTSLIDRVDMGTQARVHFNEDAKHFMLRMLELRVFSRKAQNELQNLRRPT